MSYHESTISVLSLDVVRRLLTRTGSSATDGTVDLSPPRFALKASIQDDSRQSALAGLRHVAMCENDKEYFTRRVKKVILSGNDLGARGDVGGTLLELRVFRRSVECILASNCHLESLGWHAEKKFASLVELDLSRNFLLDVPDLAACPKLRILNLAGNEITKLSLLGNTPTLMNIDLSGNKIDYDTVLEMKQDMQLGLSEMSSLLSLKLDKNPLTFRTELKDRYRDVAMFAINTCRLTQLDGPVNEEVIQRAKKLESRPEALLAASMPNSPRAAASLLTRNLSSASAIGGSTLSPKSLSGAAAAAGVSSRGGGMDAAAAGGMPPKLRKGRAARELAQDLTFHCTLSDLDVMLESCLTSSSEASATLDQLLIEAHRVVAAGGGGLFLQEETQTSRAALITQDFMQKTVALSERRPELRRQVLVVLTVLCRVEEEPQFGQACFRQLRVFMGANEETKQDVIAVLGEHLPLTTLADVRLVGELTELAERADCSELLCHGQCIAFVVLQLRNPMLHTANKRHEREVCFRFLAVASRNERARVRFGQESVGDILAPEFDKPSSPRVRLWVLETVKNLSAGGVRNGRKATNLFFADFVVTPPMRLHRNLLRELDQPASSSQRSVVSEEEDGDELMALQIDVLVVLLERSKLAFTDLCATTGTNALYQILGRFFLPPKPPPGAAGRQLQPVRVQASVYRAVASLLTTSTQNWCPLITPTSTRTRRDVVDEMQRAVFRSEDVCVLLDMLRPDSAQYSECWAAAAAASVRRSGETDAAPPPPAPPAPPAPAFKDLHEAKVHDVIVAVIDLVRAFNSAAQSGLGMAKQVSDRMNAKGRETRLFACLEIPSDAVRLAAVRCLDSVKLSQFDSNEIQFLLKLLKEVRDVSTGRTEEVLSISLGILTKLSRQGGAEFERKFGKTSVEVCLRLLEMNVGRDTRGMEREAEEKRLLTQSCLRLLLQASNASSSPSMRQHMLSEPVTSKVSRILAVEDGLVVGDRKPTSSSSSSSSSSSHDPVLVELACFSVTHLTSVFASGASSSSSSSSSSVSPTGPVAARVLRRIANLLTSPRDGVLVPEVEQAMERYPHAKHFVQAEASRERDMDAEWWSLLAHAMRGGAGKRDGTANAKEHKEADAAASEDEQQRINLHEEFLQAGCLQHILQRLSKTTMTTAATSASQKQQQQQQPLVAPFLPTNPRLGHPSSTLPQLLDRHLMCERERTNTQDTGGDLRSLHATLSSEQVSEAQRDMVHNVSMDDEYHLETLAAAARLLFALLKFGTPETRHAAQRTLREPANFALVVSLLFGVLSGAHFCKLQLGGKFFLVVDAVLDLPVLRRQEHSTSDIKRHNQLVFACADRAMGLLRNRLQFQSHLAPGDEFLVKACMSACGTIAHQLEYLDGGEDEQQPSPEELFAQLVPSTLLSSALHLLLFDMSPKKPQSSMAASAAGTAATGGGGGRFLALRRNAFGETVEDDARERTIVFLSYCLRHSPPHRYSIIEFLIRSNTIDPFPIRRILIQELLKRTHKIGSTQRVALEYLLSDEDARAEEEDALGVAAAAAAAKKEKTEDKEPAAAAAPPPSPPPPAPSSSWFAWCSGSARKPTAANEKEQDDEFDDHRHTSRPQAAIAHHAQQEKTYAELWPRFPPAASAQGAVDWTADRLGARARVVAHSFVMVSDASSCDNDDARAKTWFYESCIVLTSESYYLFRVRAQDFDFPKRWQLVWRRPYRAVTRLALGSSRVHLAHRSSDAAASAHDDDDAGGDVLTLFTPSRSSAKELATAFYQLSQAWHALLRQEGNPPPCVRAIESGHSERFRVANSMFSSAQQQQQHVVSSGMMFCDLVRFCARGGNGGDGSGAVVDEKWRLAVGMIQHETLLFLDKQEWVFDDMVTKPVPVLGTYDLAPKNQVLKPLLRMVDFSLNAEPPSPALVLEFGSPSEKRSVAIAFLDDLTRAVWRRHMLEKFFKTL